MNEKKTYFIEVNGSKSYFNYDEGTANVLGFKAGEV